MMSLLDHALQWARRGLPVFPLRPRSKYPFPGTHGCKDATRDEADITESWECVPDANIGLATGFGFFVIDLDGPDAEAWWINACSRHGKPDETLEQRTARGRHIFFWAPVEIPNSASLLAPKVDVRGHGGYIVGAPSAHPDGSTYLILRDVPIANAPRWLTDLAVPDPPRHAPLTCIQREEGASRPAGVTGVMDYVRRAQPGERNHVLYWAACRLAESGDEAAAPLLRQAAQAVGLPAHEITATIASAFRRVR